ncbi:hypothetical protein [Methylorubrum zatmanii]
MRLANAAGAVVNPATGAAGSTPSSAYSVQRTTGIATTGTLVSAANSASGLRRTIRNIGTVALEIVVAAGDAYGSGHPLPSGESFTFDDTGRTTAAVYCAGASAGGAVSVISY